MTDAWGALQQREHNLRSFQVSADREFARFLAGLSPVGVVCESGDSMTASEIKLMRPKRRKPRRRRVSQVVRTVAVAPARQLEIAIAALEKQEALKGQKASR